MVISERNRMIRQIHADHPNWSLQKIADLVGISRQRVHQVVHTAIDYDIMQTDMKNIIRLNCDPISPSQAARLTGIPKFTIISWAHRGLVTILKHPGKTARGKTVLLDPVSLQERINRYRPRKKSITN